MRRCVTRVVLYAAAALGFQLVEARLGEFADQLPPTLRWLVTRAMGSAVIKAGPRVRRGCPTDATSGLRTGWLPRRP